MRRYIAVVVVGIVVFGAWMLARRYVDQHDGRSIIASWQPFPDEEPYDDSALPPQLAETVYLLEEDERNSEYGERLHVQILSTNPLDYGSQCVILDEDDKLVIGGSARGAEGGGVGDEFSVKVTKYPSGTRFKIVAVYEDKDGSENQKRVAYITRP